MTPPRRDRSTWLWQLAAQVLAAPLRVRSPERPADAIVVLGCPLRPDGQLSAVAAERVAWGVALWQRGLAPALWFTGGGPTGRVEADAMAARARQLGVPADAVRVERQARTTEANARLIAAGIGAGKTVWVVTQPFHLRRAMFWFRRHGLVPLGYWPAESVQFREPRWALRWIAREYGAWLSLLLRGR